MFPFVFGRFLLGCWVARKRLLHAIGMNPQAALSAPALWAWRTILRCGELGLGAAYASAFALLYINQKWRPRLEILAPVGRMAFTNYLMQSLVFSLVLSGFGLGMARHWDFAALVAFGLAFFFVVQLPLSRWWLSHHEQGPLEALWRRFTYG